MQPIEFPLQVPVPVEYKGVRLDGGYRIDVLVERRQILEMKSVEVVMRIPQAQLPSCLKWMGVPAGLLLCVHVDRLRDGMTRFRL